MFLNFKIHIKTGIKSQIWHIYMRPSSAFPFLNALFDLSVGVNVFNSLLIRLHNSLHIFKEYEWLNESAYRPEFRWYGKSSTFGKNKNWLLSHGRSLRVLNVKSEPRSVCIWYLPTITSLVSYTSIPLNQWPPLKLDAIIYCPDQWWLLNEY